jgi:hypothetical protein
MATLTTNLGLSKPDVASTNWGGLMNGNLDALDSAVGTAQTNIATNSTSLANKAAKGANTDITSLTALALGTVAAPSVAVTGAATGMYFPTNATIMFAGAGVDRVFIGSGGDVAIANASAFRFSSTTSPNGTADLYLYREAPGTLGIRNGSGAQAMRLYSTFTDASNFERMNMFYSAADGAFVIGSEAAGTGVTRNIAFQTNGAVRWYIDRTNGHFFARSDAAYDIGGSGANRVRSFYLTGAISSETSVSATSGANSNSPSHQFKGSYWDGAAAQADIFTIQNQVLSGTNPSTNLVVSHSGTTGSALFQVGAPGATSGIALTTYGSLSTFTPTLATVSANASSPVVQIMGNYWDGTTSQVDRWQIINNLATGSNPASTLTFQHLGSTGGAFVQMPNITIGATGANCAMGSAGITLRSDMPVQWSSSAVTWNGTIDLALLRDGANALAQRNGTSGQQFRLYSTYTDGANYERLTIGPTSTTPGNFFLNAEAAGTGVGRGIGFAFSGAKNYFFTSGGLTIASGLVLRFNPTGDATTASDTGISRTAVGTLSVGNATNGDVTGKLLAANLSNIVAKVSLTGQTASIANTTLVTAPASGGTYRISVYSYTQTIGTAGTLDVQVTGFNGSFSASQGYTTFAGSPGVQSLSGASYRRDTFIFHMGAGNVMQYATVVTGATGAPTYGVDIVVEQLQ